MPNELKISIIGDATSAHEALQNVNKAIGESADRADVFSQALKAAEVSGQSFAEAVNTAAGSLENFIANEAEAAAQTQQYSESVGASGTAHRRLVSDVQAASAAIRGLEGSLNVRAVERFAVSILGLGPILQAAFPVFGALAFAEIIGHVAGEVSKFAGEASALGRELGIGWLDAAIAQMTGLGKAVKQADAEIENLNRDIDSQRERQKTAGEEYITLTQGQAAGYRAKAEATQADIASLEKSIKLAQERYEIESKGAEIRTNAFGSKVTDNPEGLLGALKSQKNAEEDKKQIDDQTERLRTLQLEYRNLTIEAQKAADAEAKKSEKKEFASEKREDSVNFDVERLAAQQAIKDEEDITKAIEKRDKSAIKAMNDSVRAAEELKTADQRVTDEIETAWVKMYNEQIRDAERNAKEQERIDDKLRAEKEATARHIAEVYRDTTAKITGDLEGGVDAWLRGGESMARAWTDVGDKMALSIVNALLRIGAEELVALATHQAVAESQRLEDARTAASNSYAWASSWGGPIAGAIAAAVAFSAVAAFDTGTDYVPKTGLAVIHQGERILNTQQNEAITRSLTQGKSGQGGENHFHYSPSISGIDGASVAGMARSHGNTFLRQAARQMRIMGRSQG